MPIISPKIPSGLEELMRGLAKSVIKENPQNIYEFAAEYFENLLKERDGSVDQSYKKFATYKVYKKNKNARQKREKENLNDVNDVTADNGFRKDVGAVNYEKQSKRNSTVGGILLPAASQSLQVQAENSISSESEIIASIKREDSLDVEGGAPPSPGGNSMDENDDDDIKNMVLDDDMAQAALKIQSTFRGHKARKEVKEMSGGEISEDVHHVEKESANVEIETITGKECEVEENEIVVEKVQSQEAEGFEGAVNEIEIETGKEKIESNDCQEAHLPQTEDVDDDDIANMVLDEDMEQAALKIQSTFRGHKTRKEMKENDQDVKEDLREVDGQKNDVKEEEKIANIDNEAEIIEKEEVDIEAVEENENEKLSAEQSVQEEQIIDDELVKASVDDEKALDDEALADDDIAHEVIEDIIVPDKVTESLASPDVEDSEVVTVIESEETVTAEAESIKAEEVAESTVEIDTIAELTVNDEELAVETTEVEEIVASENADEEVKVEDDIATIKGDESLPKDEQASLSSAAVEEETIEVEVPADVVADGGEDVIELKVVENAVDEVLDEAQNVVENLDIVETLEESAVEAPEDNAQETEKTSKDIEEALPEDEHSLKNGENVGTEVGANKLQKQPSTVIDEALEISENLLEASNDDFIELTETTEIVNDNVDGEEEESKTDENENCAEKPQEDCVAVEGNEQEPQKQLNELANESETLLEDDAEYVDCTPVVEEECQRKSIVDLVVDEETVELECDDKALIRENNQEKIDESHEDNLEKVPSGEIEYSTLKESLSEHDVTPVESVDEVDKSRDLTDEEKSIDGDSCGSKQLSFDELQNADDDEKAAEQEKKANEGLICSSTVDDIEMNAAATTAVQQAKSTEEGIELMNLNEAPAVECILKSEISPIELMDEIVNERAGAVASELFNSTANIDDAKDEETKSIDKDDGRETESVDPKLKDENPLNEIESSKSIKLSQENVERAQDEQNAIIDEMEENPFEDSEIPEEESSKAPMDENIPTVSMDDDKNVSATVNDENVEAEAGMESEPEPSKLANDEDDEIANMVLDDDMEDAALKIQAAFRGHKVRKVRDISQQEESEQQQEEENVENSVVVDQCSEDNQETQDNQEHEETEQQDTSADVEEIQESEDQEQTQEETHEEENTEEETAVDSAENDTAEQTEDDPDGTPEEGEASEQQQNDDDDVANMVLDEEMEQAALKIQSTFRGHKTRKDMKKDDEGEASTADESKEQKDDIQDVDDEIANMVLDDEMAQAALKIQSTFRGHKSRKDLKKDNEGDDEKKEEEEAAEDKKEDEPVKEEESAASSSEKSAKQLQEEEDIANIVMDEEMEQTALKIQSAFRGKMGMRKKKPKDEGETTGSSAGDQTNDDEEEEEEGEKTDDDPFQQDMNQAHEHIGESFYEDEKDSDYSAAAHYSPSGDDPRYSVDRYDGSYDYEPLQAATNTSTDDINLMQGGGIFPEPSGESSDMLLTGSSGEDKDPDRNSSYENVPSDEKSPEDDEMDESISQKKSIDQQLNDEEAIEKFDFDANKDTAEAMYYSLKKNEIETQKRLSADKQLSVVEGQQKCEPMETMTSFENQSIDCAEEEEEEVDEDDDDVVIGTQAPPTSAKRLKYGMSMDDRLLGSILSQDYTAKARRDGGYNDDGFDPLLEATMRNHHFLEKLHEVSHSDEGKNVPTYDDYPGDDEDQFDDFYHSNNIRQKIMASSISIADSDYFDPMNNKSIIDDDKIRTALETIHSTDSESTIASAATKIPVGLMTKRNINITSHSMQYSSIGNAAIDRSLDEFIQSQELRIEKFEEEMEGYSSPPPRKQQQESVDDWTDDTATYTDSDKHKPAGAGGVIEIKLEQKPSFLTVDERRRTLHREDAIQRNSTREDEDSSKASSHASGEKLLDNASKEITTTMEPIVAEIVPQASVVDTEIIVPVLDLTAQSSKASSSQSLIRPHRMKRQHTMPVQIQTDVIRVVPKHLRKRIKSADGDKKKRASK